MIPSPFFSHRMTKGYSSPAIQIVHQLNGIPVKNLAHLITMLRDSTDEYLEFTFFGNEIETLVFRREELLNSTEDVLSDNGIRKQFSDDLEPIWKK